MKCKQNLKIIVIVIVSLSPVFSQTWQDDWLIVRQILDTNGLQAIQVEHITTMDSSGRINSLSIDNKPFFKLLPASIGLLDKLTNLEISRTILDSIPAEIEKLDSLNTFRLYSNKLISLPSEIGSLKSLTYLNVACNDLNTFPNEIGNLNKLNTIYAYKNNITHLPKEIGNCESLTYIDLAHNQLTTLPDEIANLNLEQIQAEDNLITDIPEDMGYMPKIEFANFSENKLKHIPNSLTNFPAGLFLLCDNDSLTFTDEQKSIWDIKDYEDYYFKYCVNEVEEKDISQKQPSTAQIDINSQVIFLHVNRGGHITCSVYNLCGRRIETLVSGVLSAGTHNVPWKRAHYAPGIYFVRYFAADGHSSIKTVVIK